MNGPSPHSDDPPGERFIRSPCFGQSVSTLQVSRLESLILEMICSLDYVSMAGYSDDGREVTVLVVHDNDPDRDSAIVRGIGNGGRAIGREIRDRMISPLPIPGGPGLPTGILSGSKVIYERERGQ